MCGIYGWQVTKGSIKPSQLSIAVAVLGAENDRRGGDSWGVYFPRSDRLERGLGDISLAVNPRELARHRSVMAHTRKATTGKVIVANSHPFRIGGTVGAHNGMVYNHAELNRWHDRDCAVDSQHLFHHIEDDSDLSEIEGYGAVEYVRRSEPGRVYMARFNGGELSAFALEGGGLLWSSARKSLHRAVCSAGLDGRFYTVEESVLYFAEGGMLYQTDRTIPIGERMGWEDAPIGDDDAPWWRGRHVDVIR